VVWAELGMLEVVRSRVSAGDDNDLDYYHQDELDDPNNSKTSVAQESRGDPQVLYSLAAK
jgi:hypothetical protein